MGAILSPKIPPWGQMLRGSGNSGQRKRYRMCLAEGTRRGRWKNKDELYKPDNYLNWVEIITAKPQMRCKNIVKADRNIPHAYLTKRGIVGGPKDLSQGGFAPGFLRFPSTTAWGSFPALRQHGLPGGGTRRRKKSDVRFVRRIKSIGRLRGKVERTRGEA